MIRFSDSLSVLLKDKTLDNPLLVKMLCKLNPIFESKEIVMYWIPNHVGIIGNDKVNSAAKCVINKEIDLSFKVPYTDQKNQIKRFNK